MASQTNPIDATERRNEAASRAARVAELKAQGTLLKGLLQSGGLSRLSPSLNAGMASPTSFAMALAAATANRLLTSKTTLATPARGADSGTPASTPGGTASRSARAGVAKGAETAATAGAASGEVPYREMIASAAKKHGVNPALVAALVRGESSFNPRAVSYVGAKGLMQLMDGTARSLGVTDPFDPAQNLDGGTKYLGSLLKKYGGDIRLAIAGYNAGPGAVDQYGGVPPYKETQAFITRVLEYMKDYETVL